MINSRSSASFLSLLATAALHAQLPTIRDSAGIRIVENRAGMTGPAAFTLGTAHTKLGGLEDDPKLEFNARGEIVAIRLRNGAIAVAEPTRIHFFDRTGKRQRILGREGRGPADFQRIRSLCESRGDTVIANDLELERGSIINGRGILREVPLQVGDGFPHQFCFSDGTLLVAHRLPNASNGPQSFRLFRADLNGGLRNVVVPEVGTGPVDDVTGREAFFAAGGMNVYVALAITSEIQIHSAAGRLTTIVRTADQPREVTPDQVAAMPPAFWRKGASPDEIKATQKRRAIEQNYKSLPTYGQMLVDPTGRIWVRRWQPQFTVPLDRWLAFDAKGHLIGALDVPASQKVQDRRAVVAFGINEVLIRYVDDDGAHLVAYPLVATSGRE